MKIAIVSLFILICAVTVGCKQSTPTAPAGSTAAGTTDSHDHDHAHEDHGPHGGHMVHLEPTGSHAEWTHDDDAHLISVYLDDFDAAKVATVKFTAKIGDALEEFPLTSSDGTWNITSQELLTHINMKDAAEVNLVVVDDSGVHTAKIEAHEHHHH